MPTPDQGACHISQCYTLLPCLMPEALVQTGPCVQVADLETLLSRLRASQFHLQGSVQRSMGPYAAMLVGSGVDTQAHARY